MALAEELHKILYSDLSWHDKALCKGSTHIFFSERGANEDVYQAKLICSKCPVSSECLNYAMTNNIKHGVWGGFSRKQRIKIKKDLNSK
jgi:WhiB family redox-sensing transcriptional regulator